MAASLTLESPAVRTYADQITSGGASEDEIIEGALAAADPEPELRWLDIGCGRGDLLRRVRAEFRPAALHGVDPIDWLADDLRGDVRLHTVPAEEVSGLEPMDRVMLVEVIEHLEAPWTVLRSAARLLRPGGTIVVTTPNLATLRNRLELALRGNLTSFRPDYEPHVSPALPHVTSRILSEEGLAVAPSRYAGTDVISLTGGRKWPSGLRTRYPVLTSISVIVSARRA
jgi:SAM-dependent methyltransferase